MCKKICCLLLSCLFLFLVSCSEPEKDNTPNLTYPTNAKSDFVIVDGMIKKYNNNTVANLIIPDTATAIGPKVFTGNSALRTVTISDTVKTIGKEAFFMCPKLYKVKIGKNVTTIEDRAFYHNTSLLLLEIGDNVTSIGKDAFTGCTKLKVKCKPGSYAAEYFKDKATILSTNPSQASSKSTMKTIVVPRKQ
ncbi:MAG: hypothetical protein BGN88_00315 [Clostridiales bacterium 43-6]|nr:MAG: hypothetical protein BGN88_00315 [Clostridiales bacterium 43-6]